MNNKRNIFIVVFLSLVLVGVFLWFFVVRDDVEIDSEEFVEVEQELPVFIENTVPVISTPVVNSDPVTTEEAEEIYMKKLARDFVERFESRSEYNDNEHIDDAISLATPKLASWIETLRNKKEFTGGEGISTRVLSVNIEEKTIGKVVLSIDVQQEKQVIDNETVIEYKSGTIVLENINNVWLVAGWFWEKNI
jgi:hypothetical protein